MEKILFDVINLKFSIIKITIDLIFIELFNKYLPMIFVCNFHLLFYLALLDSSYSHLTNASNYHPSSLDDVTNL